MFTKDWFSSKANNWKKWLAGIGSIENSLALEIGSFEGRSAIFTLENVLHETGRLICVDPHSYEGEDLSCLSNDIGFRVSSAMKEAQKRFLLNTERFRNTGRLEYVNKRSFEFLSCLGPDVLFDFVYIDGSHHAQSVIEDAVLSWRHLKSKGILVFDDYHWRVDKRATARPKIAIDSFLQIYADEYELLGKGEQVAVRRI